VADRHDAHDLGAVVAFVDGELAGAELEAAAAQVGDCPDCALLVADLRSLALADRALATPVRPRDFRLTAADAERLTQRGPEPLAAATRLGHDMTTTPATHATHDPELIAAALGGSLDPSERRLIDDRLATCGSCAELHADLLAIASAQRALPTPSRPRDFRLTPADAHRLRPRGFRAVLAAIGSSRDAFSKPLAVGLTTLGLVGLLVGAVPSFGLGGATSLSTVGAAVNQYDNGKGTGSDALTEGGGDGTVFGGQDNPPGAAPSSAPSAAAPSAAAAAAPEPSAAASTAEGPVAPIIRSGAPQTAASPVADTSSNGDAESLAANRETQEAARLAAAAEGPSPLLLASLLMLLAGIALFAARWGARRLGSS
jgi:anti-sigma factor RsiW